MGDSGIIRPTEASSTAGALTLPALTGRAPPSPADAGEGLKAISGGAKRRRDAHIGWRFRGGDGNGGSTQAELALE